MTEGRDGISFAPTGARRLMGVARRLSVVTAVFAIAALVAGTAGTSYAKPHHKGPGLLDTVVVSNNGALFDGSLATFVEGAGHGASPVFLIKGTNTLLGASTGATGDSVSSLDDHIAVAMPLDFLGLTAVLGPPVGCGPFGQPAASPLFGTGLVEIFSPTATGNSAAENEICSPNFAVGAPNTTGIFFPQGVAFESPYDGITEPGHEIVAVANEFPLVFGPDAGEGACATSMVCGAPVAGESVGTITEYDRSLFTPGLNNVAPFNNSPVTAVNPFTDLPYSPANATIGGCLSLLAGPEQLSFDSNGFLFVVNNAGELEAALGAAPRFINVYAPGSSGDTFPSAVIGFNGTITERTVGQPLGVTVLTNGFEDDTMFITDAGKTSAVLNSECECADTPYSCCTGTGTGTCPAIPQGIKVFDVFVNPNIVVGFADTGELIGSINGGRTKLKGPKGIALSADGDTLYVVNNLADSLSMFTDVSEIESGGDIAPTLMVQTRASKMNLPVGVALPAFTPTPAPTYSPEGDASR
jgi:hypothetical protein